MLVIQSRSAFEAASFGLIFFIVFAFILIVRLLYSFYCPYFFFVAEQIIIIGLLPLQYLFSWRSYAPSNDYLRLYIYLVCVKEDVWILTHIKMHE